MQVTVPNEQDPLRDGPAEQRLAWEEPEPLVRAEPTKHARNATAWAEVCPAMDFETGQLVGRVGTPEEPLFTYEQAVHHRRGRDDFQLIVGRDIPAEEKDSLSTATIDKLRHLQAAVKSHKLPKLPRGVVPRGWDGWGRPWALIDCPADKVPQISSNQGGDRVTVAALVNFPPEPFYVPNVTALDYALRYCSKAGKKGTLDNGLTLEQDGQWDDPAGAYRRLKLPAYRHSVPVQELMSSNRWPAFQEGRWGNRFNPPIPEGDVRPPGATTTPPSGLNVIQLPQAITSGSPVVSVDQPSASAQSAQGVVPSSDREELAEEEMELVVPASPPKTSAPRRTPSHAKVAEAVTNMAAHLRKTGAPPTPAVTSSQRDSQASGTGTKDLTLSVYSGIQLFEDGKQPSRSVRTPGSGQARQNPCRPCS